MARWILTWGEMEDSEEEEWRGKVEGEMVVDGC
jgi:hypothetical protein